MTCSTTSTSQVRNPNRHDDEVICPYGAASRPCRRHPHRAAAVAPCFKTKTAAVEAWTLIYSEMTMYKETTCKLPNVGKKVVNNTVTIFMILLFQIQNLLKSCCVGSQQLFISSKFNLAPTGPILFHPQPLSAHFYLLFVVCRLHHLRPTWCMIVVDSHPLTLLFHLYWRCFSPRFFLSIYHASYVVRHIPNMLHPQGQV